MKTIKISQKSDELQDLLEQAESEDVILELADGREFILSAMDDFDVEIAKTRRNQKLMALLDQRARQTQTVSLAEVKRQLNLG
ncbi:hypothetical protein IFO70_16230 [Phormidium tenue FACHB-886]|nr:hypothetical protein [Phormidium tenue FACHB-886]